MPTYSYACTACGHRFDVQQAFSDATLTACPECEGRLRKLFGNVGVVFKGSGFYRTDARSERRATAGRSGRNGSSATRTAEPAPSGTPATPSTSSSPAATSKESSSTSSGTTTAPRAAAD